jgi:hypothetical protein
MTGRPIVIASTSIAVLFAFAVVAFAALTGPTTAELENDLAEINAQIKTATNSSSIYANGSVLRILGDMQLRILESTGAMLDQKRRSFLRGISLSYVVNGQQTLPASGKALDELSAEIAQTKSAIQQAESKAAAYSGGLIQTMALLEAQTHRVTLASLHQRYVIQKFGLAVPALPNNSTPPAPAVGKKIDEKGAL